MWTSPNRTVLYFIMCTYMLLNVSTEPLLTRLLCVCVAELPKYIMDYITFLNQCKGDGKMKDSEIAQMASVDGIAVYVITSIEICR
jgi:hypothetical protein